MLVGVFYLTEHTFDPLSLRSPSELVSLSSD